MQIGLKLSMPHMMTVKRLMATIVKWAIKTVMKLLLREAGPSQETVQ